MINEEVRPSAGDWITRADARAATCPLLVRWAHIGCKWFVILMVASGAAGATVGFIQGAFGWEGRPEVAIYVVTGLYIWAFRAYHAGFRVRRAS